MTLVDVLAQNMKAPGILRTVILQIQVTIPEIFLNVPLVTKIGCTMNLGENLMLNKLKELLNKEEETMEVSGVTIEMTPVQFTKFNQLLDTIPTTFEVDLSNGHSGSVTGTISRNNVELQITFYDGGTATIFPGNYKSGQILIPKDLRPHETLLPKLQAIVNSVNTNIINQFLAGDPYVEAVQVQPLRVPTDDVSV